MHRPIASPSRRLISAIVLSLVLLAPHAIAAQSGIAQDPDVLGAERLFSAWMEGQIAYRGLPGIAVGVVYDQQLVWATGFGFADVAHKIAMTPETKFRMASHSKMFTAIAIMQLREDGKLRLDDPVEKYLPWFHAKPAGPDDGPITIEQLLSHVSGLQREAGDHWTTNEFPTEAELKKLYAERQSAFAPNVRWKYSNLAFAVAGLLVEQVSGQKWADYVDKNIFKALGMNESSVDKNVPGLTVGYGRRMPDGTREIIPFIDARGMAAATGVTSNVTDMAKFVSANFGGGPRGGSQVVSGASWREMHRVRAVENNWQSGTGLGFDMRRINDKTYVGHGGGYLGNTTQTQIQLDDKIGVIVLTNTNDSNVGDIARELAVTVGAAVAKAIKPSEVAVAWDPAWERFAGLYRGRWSDQQIVLLNKKLVLVTPNGANVDSPATLEPLGGGRFRLMAPTGGGEVGEVVYFTETAGKPMRLYVGDGYFERVK
jgi:D-alanyl-D-alanine carboxypeptidase